MKNNKLNVLIKVSLLSVMGFLLMYVELPLPLFPEFLKIDVSDLPALIGTFALGPVQGVIIELIKNILHGIFATKTAFVGELANFLVGSVMILTAGFIYRNNKNRKSAIIGLIFGTIVMSVAAGIFNYYLLLPLYERALHIPLEAFVQLAQKINPKVTNINAFIIWTIIPFNFIKGVFVSIITVVIYKSVSPILHKESIKKQLANNN
ncbi:riboflavin transporter FmnP [Clostridium tetanomorphum]|uniref:Riboflavin transporter n=1 Tax=Clostridium tetanomorphum TaxID=1553 RepID=A0A923J310_CLOTT|nr:ECF transporter S component [Clostridium tetanomorphum]KAJ53235.1 riboflavin transporter [Clostridium tetanomorphum DSM 665]MBC2399458.1 ECF transporter S component [Clostridium tetanomorphum]MBP1865734.1 riboflavin transporter FmnP [Clostridium tetanomorphum]NRS86854.1 riboflavin transporter FmnP [Clostridium tetanomorphum]NRZ99388.1 riboflavin transporter FmnP [Clostridium tetanomorphum]